MEYIRKEKDMSIGVFMCLTSFADIYVSPGPTASSLYTHLILPSSFQFHPLNRAHPQQYPSSNQSRIILAAKHSSHFQR